MTFLYSVISQNDANDGVQKNEHKISLHIYFEFGKNEHKSAIKKES